MIQYAPQVQAAGTANQPTLGAKFQDSSRASNGVDAGDASSGGATGGSGTRVNGGRGSGGNATSGDVIGGNGGDRIAATSVIIDGTTAPQFNLSGCAGDDGFSGAAPHATGNDPDDVIQVPGIHGSIRCSSSASSVAPASAGSANAAEIASVRALLSTGAGVGAGDQRERVLLAGGLLALMGAAMATLRRKSR